MEAHRSLLLDFQTQDYTSVDTSQQSFELLIWNIGNAMLVTTADWLDYSKYELEELETILKVKFDHA